MHPQCYNSAHDIHFQEGSYLQEGRGGTQPKPFLSIYHAGVLGL